MVTKSGRWAVLLANALLVTALAIFAAGFFPHKVFLPGMATWSTEVKAAKPNPPFDKVIFMVIDALRSDFVYGNASNFAFTQSLIRDGAAVPLTGHASPPTITMPRVKAITTGSVPSFVDLVLNFAESDTTSTLATQDSWLSQIRARNSGKLVMYGDDTWLRLFPGFFERADGTTSFFVSDFTEVDNNVTRHIPEELQQDDWAVMALHFLGLDHIGHKTGPKGPNMPAKQAEMDGVVKQIYNAISNQKHLRSCLLVILGDHGMNEAGNHGASSRGEVSTALTFISPLFKKTYPGLSSPIEHAGDYKFYNEVEQSDIAPTLAALLGFPVPRNNLGVIVPDILNLWTDDTQKYRLLHENAQQIYEIARGTFPAAFRTDGDFDPCSLRSPTDGEQLSCLWKKIAPISSKRTTSETKIEIESLWKFLHSAQATLGRTASNYDLFKMQIGTAVSITALGLSLYASGPALFSGHLSGALIVVMSLLYAAMMFASSYVEEEHQFWYWFLAGWLAVLFCKTGRFRVRSISNGQLTMAGCFLLFLVVRRWRQTGQKYAGEPDILTDIMIPYPWTLWILVVLTYTIYSRQLTLRASQWADASQLLLLPILVSISTFCFKVAFTSVDAPELLQNMIIFKPLLRFLSRYPLVSLARVVFIGLLHTSVIAAWCEKPWRPAPKKNFFSQEPLESSSFLDTFHSILSLFLMTQTRTVNIPIFLFFSGILHYLQKQLPRRLSRLDISITSILFQHASYFMFGGTNAISSVDLSNAYNGVSGYNVLAVGFLTFVGNWAGPIWWVSATRILLSKSRPSTIQPRYFVYDGKNLPPKPDNGRFTHFAISTSFVAMATSAIMLACFVLREHLFIWTVFSPKYLYLLAWVLGQHCLVNGLAWLI